MNALQVLRAARKKISTPNKWTKNTFVQRTEKGRGYCYCAMGAVRNVDQKVDGTFDQRIEVRKEAVQFLRKALRKVTRKASGEPSTSPYPIYFYNDAPRRTHPQILHLFDVAIELAKKEASK